MKQCIHCVRLTVQLFYSFLGENRDTYEKIYELITQKLQNLTNSIQPNEQNLPMFLLMNNSKSVANVKSARPSPNFLAKKSTLNTGQTKEVVLDGSINGLTSHEDRSSLYANLQDELSTDDKKNTIHRQDYQSNGQPATSVNYAHGLNDNYGIRSPGFKRTRTRNPVQQTRNYEFDKTSSYSPANYQAHYYHGVQEQKSWPGFQRSPGYQVRYPALSAQSFIPGYSTSVTETRDKVPVRQSHESPAINDHVTSVENFIFKTADRNVTNRFSPESATKAKAKAKLSQESIATSSHPLQFLSDDVVAGSASGSGTGLTDLQESPETEGSGTGRENISDVAFMLAGTNDLAPSRLPTKLTKQQALDIYNSALYFAGLMEKGEYFKQHIRRYAEAAEKYF